MTNTEKRLEEKNEHIAYSPEVNLIRPILAKYMNEWSADMLGELAKILNKSITQAIVEERERVVKEIEKYMSYCVDLQNKAIANGNAITVETWGDRWVGAKRILSSLDKPLTDKE